MKEQKWIKTVVVEYRDDGSQGVGMSKTYMLWEKESLCKL